MDNHNWEWEEEPREPIGITGCLIWFSVLIMWSFIFYALFILTQDTESLIPISTL